ncbi:hypothetical protein CUJ84_pRLN1000595 (plasmid) [Rhizobium leguminosarum]|uniref:Uncharacterized protein n=1 Tax=Rhizobium leguminosarum TaxID=384 RepID=A0A2K9ZCS3_RHILE|nr:hypothetical protein CUJ84_pRLN1000595 [Rhizobium leguminosarum]
MIIQKMQLINLNNFLGVSIIVLQNSKGEHNAEPSLFSYRRRRNCTFRTLKHLIRR